MFYMSKISTPGEKSSEISVLDPLKIYSAYGQVYLDIRPSGSTDGQEIPLGVLFAVGMQEHNYRLKFDFSKEKVHFQPSERVGSRLLEETRIGVFHAAQVGKGYLFPGTANGPLELRLTSTFPEGELFLGKDETQLEDLTKIFPVHEDGDKPYVSFARIPLPQGCMQIREGERVAKTFFYTLRVHLAQELSGRHWMKVGEFKKDSLDQAYFSF